MEDAMNIDKIAILIKKAALEAEKAQQDNIIKEKPRWGVAGETQVRPRRLFSFRLNGHPALQGWAFLPPDGGRVFRAFTEGLLHPDHIVPFDVPYKSIVRMYKLTFIILINGLVFDTL